MLANTHIIPPNQLRQLSGKRTASAVRRWASSQGIRVMDGKDGPWTTIEALNAALGVASNTEPYRAEDIA